MTRPPRSPWHHPLVREISVILLIKLLVLFSIKAIWFSPSDRPTTDSGQLAEHLLHDARSEHADTRKVQP